MVDCALTAEPQAYNEIRRDDFITRLFDILLQIRRQNLVRGEGGRAMLGVNAILVADTRLYHRRCSSIGPSILWSVH